MAGGTPRVPGRAPRDPLSRLPGLHQEGGRRAEGKRTNTSSNAELLLLSSSEILQRNVLLLRWLAPAGVAPRVLHVF